VTRIVFVTQRVDAQHPVLAATIAKLRALAERFDEVVVLADSAVPGALPPNCRVKTFAARTRAGRCVRFLRALAPELGKADAVVAHMVPVYAVLASLLARPRGVPVLLWYTQWRSSRMLRLAERVSTHVVSVEHASFPFASRKLVPIGHGIDPAELTCRTEASEPGLRLLALGRYSPVKRYETMLRAVRRARDAGVEATLAVHGPVSNDLERRHRAELERLVDELGLGDAVVLGEALPRDQALARIALVDALVSATVRGAADKVVLEAALSCVPAFVPDWAFDGLVPEELRYDGGVESLAGRLEAFGQVHAAARHRLGETLRQRALVAHSVGSWADALMRAAAKEPPPGN
jgi:glycosyltransferase involved in cell wall biosynthesis